MVLKSFQIVLEDPSAVYRSGQPITGTLMMSVDSPEHILGIIIHFKGDTSVKWRKTSYNVNNAAIYTTTYTSKETYFEKSYDFLVRGVLGPTLLQTGEHRYPFNAVLPLNLPTSHEGKYGRIRYSVKAVCTMIKLALAKPREIQIDAKAIFNVVSHLNLNLHETARNQVRITKEKYFSSLFKSGFLVITVSLPFTGYVPGQEIPIVVHLEKATNTLITAFTCALFMNTAYLSKTPYSTIKLHKEKICELKYGPALKVNSKTWKLPFSIPYVPPSDLINCSLIDLNYDLEIKGAVAGYNQDIEVKVPLVIGTIPFARLIR